jgi:hypothetical protein
MESDNQESSNEGPPERREKEQDREKKRDKKDNDRREADKKEKTKRKDRKRREEERAETENEMDWEDNLTGVDKLLYPDEGETDEEMVDEEGLLSDSSEYEDRSDSEVRRKEEEDEIAKRMRTQARAEAYLERKRAEAEARFNSYMENLAVNKLEYDAVRRIHAEELKTIRTDGLEPPGRGVGSFVNSMDGRLYITGMSTSLADKKNVTTSFNPVSLSCYGCEVNHAANMWKSEKEVKDLTAEAFCLTDQAYPPVFPFSSNLNCLKVIRREDGTLMELANELLALVRGKEVHKQSIVLMHSLSHMAKAGTEGYIEDFLVAASKLKAALGVHIQVVPLPHLFMAGCTCPLVIRTAAEVTVWAGKTFGDDSNFLTNSFKLSNHLSPRMGDDCQTDYERLVRLPMAAKWPSNKAIWVMSSFELPLAIHPTTEGAEREIILSIIGELRTGLALELDQSPSLDRKMPARGWGGQPESIDYLIFGRTKTSAMMADALVRKGKKCELVSYPEWRITQAFVARMDTDLAAAMAAKRPKAIIVAGLDESYYMAQYEEVHTSPARKDVAGHYHIDGDLIVAAKTAQLRMLNIMAPVIGWVDIGTNT